MVEFLQWFAVEYIKFALFFGVIIWICAYAVNQDDMSRLDYAKLFVYSVVLFPILFVEGIWLVIEDLIINGDKKN